MKTQVTSQKTYAKNYRPKKESFNFQSFFSNKDFGFVLGDRTYKVELNDEVIEHIESVAAFYRKCKETETK